MEALAASVGLAGIPTELEIGRRKCQLKIDCQKRWAEQESQGVGLNYFRDDPLCNGWLLDQRVLPPWMYIRASQYRTNTFGTRVAINRTTRGGVTSCRKCHLKPWVIWWVNAWQ